MPNVQQDLERSVRLLDETLLGTIESQTSVNDKRALLALHAAAGEAAGNFTYLEVGSHLGGSLQALVRDLRCSHIVSIDPRPLVQPDQRGTDYVYQDNSSERMLTVLRGIEGADTSKITVIEASTEAIAPRSVTSRPDLAFIDGEHTDAATLRDARFCKSVLAAGGGVIAFHDSWIVYRAISAFLADLAHDDLEFQPVILPDSVIAVEIGQPRLLETSVIKELIPNGAWGYLESLRLLGAYREALARPVPRLLRRLGLIDVHWS